MEGFKRIYKTKANVSIPAYMALIIATIGLMSIPISVAADREKRALRRLRATPVRPQAILIAWVVVYFLVALVGAVLLVVSGKVVCGLRFEGNPLSVFPAFVLSTPSLAAFGFAIASLAQTGRTADIIGIVLFFSIVFLSGATIPWQEPPEGVRMMGHALPLTYVVRLLQGLWFAGAWSGHLNKCGGCRWNPDYRGSNIREDVQMGVKRPGVSLQPAGLVVRPQQFSICTPV